MRSISKYTFVLVVAGLSGAVRADFGPHISDRILQKEVVVDAPVEKVWWAWTTSEGIASFFSPESKIELHIGGAYEMTMGMKEPDESGGRGSEGCKLLAYVPNEMLSFEWNFPPKVMSLRKSHAKTWVVLRFNAMPGGKTRVRFAQLGWKEGSEWDAGYAYFENAWGHVLQQLKDKVKGGTAEDHPAEKPRTWENGHVQVTAIDGPPKLQIFEMTVPAPLQRVWETLASSEGLRSLGGKDSEVQLRPGGKYAFWPAANNRVLTFVPGELLVISGSAPPDFPNVRKGGTWGAYTFEKSGENETKLRLISVGWRPGEKEWDGAFDYFLKNNPKFLSKVYSVATGPGVDRSILRQEKDVDGSVDQIWHALMTKEGLESWMVAHAEIDLRLGGRMLTQYDKSGVIGDPGTIENIILAYEPQRMYVIKVGKPPEKFPFKHAVKDLWTVVRMEPISDRRTHVTITGVGYTGDEESQNMRQFFEQGNQWTLDKLQEKFAGESKSARVEGGLKRGG